MAMQLVRRGARYLPKAFVSPRALPKPRNAVQVCGALVGFVLMTVAATTAMAAASPIGRCLD